MMKQFDVSQVFEIRIFSAGRKSCKVRFPSDPEWRDFFRAQSVVRQVAEGGLVEASSYGGEAAAATLLLAIRQDQDATFDEFDAAAAIRKLDYMEVVSSRIGNERFHFVMGAVLTGNKAAFDALQHELRLPTQRQMTLYRRRAMRVLEGRQKTEYRQPLEPGEELYDALAVGAVNYAAGKVPANHKAFVAENLLAAVDRMLNEDEEDGENESPEA